MLLGGFWHGANWTFLIWGAWHGAWLAVERYFNVDAAPKVIRPWRWAFTFLLVIIGWVIFRAENLDVAWRMYGAMFSFADWRLSELTLAKLTSLQMVTLVLAYGVMAWCGLRQFYRAGAPKAPGTTAVTAATDATMSLDGRVLLTRICLLLLFVVSVMKLSAQSFSPFLYFQF